VIEWNVEEAGIAVVRFAHPPANALDMEFLAAIVRTLDEIESSDARAMIVTGNGSVFSAGADLFRILEEGRDYIDLAGPLASAAFARMVTFPRPTVAAVNGHAIAGGCVLACACDYRVAAAGDVRIGLAELAVGVPFPIWALETVRLAVGSDRMRGLILGARTLGVEDAKDAGFVDEVVPVEELMERARAAAKRLARVPPDTYELTKRAILAPMVERAERATALDEEGADLWASEEVRESIRSFLRRTLGTDTR
jgi:enoyl-CoA hydratase